MPPLAHTGAPPAQACGWCCGWCEGGWCEGGWRACSCSRGVPCATSGWVFPAGSGPEDAGSAGAPIGCIGTPFGFSGGGLADWSLVIGSKRAKRSSLVRPGACAQRMSSDDIIFSRAVRNLRPAPPSVAAAPLRLAVRGGTVPWALWKPAMSAASWLLLSHVIWVARLLRSIGACADGGCAGADGACMSRCKGGRGVACRDRRSWRYSHGTRSTHVPSELFLQL